MAGLMASTIPKHQSGVGNADVYVMGVHGGEITRVTWHPGYDEVVGWAEMMREVIGEGRMPPWFAEEGSGPWRNDASLTPQEQSDLLAWIAAVLVFQVGTLLFV